MLTTQPPPDSILGTLLNPTLLHLGAMLTAHSAPLDLVGAGGDLALRFGWEERFGAVTVAEAFFDGEVGAVGLFAVGLVLFDGCGGWNCSI
eukprot:scaffold8559_cov135-Skeletonema_marinoi.AAC.1